MVPATQYLWDGVTLIVCTGALYFVLRLYLSFRGGEYGAAYVYNAGAGLVLRVAFVVKFVLDFMGLQPDDYGISLRDGAIIVALALFALGLRTTRNFWNPSKQRSTSRTE